MERLAAARFLHCARIRDLIEPCPVIELQLGGMLIDSEAQSA
jgi:hypothetical protein